MKTKTKSLAPHLKYHVIKDPVHGTMQFTTTEDNWIKPFIDSPLFQRLRHIKQLGMGDYIFPGAVHTRFNHCLGCCYVASQIANKIGLPEQEKQLVMVAGLLHDIGHGPFSHTFEDVFYQKLIRHEAWTPFFLSGFRTEEFFKHYHQRNPKHPLTEETFLQIEKMIMHKSAQKQLLADIVSSQLDADRLDYLLRDSHFCGVTYGEFDFRWMLHSLLVIDTPYGERLGISHKGIGVIEHYLMARRLMMRNIYHHQKKLAIEYFLVQLLASVAESLESYSAYRDIKATRLGKFLLAVNQFNQAASRNPDHEPLKQQFLQDNFADYKELCDYDVFALIKLLAHSNNAHPAAQIATRLHDRQMPKTVRFNPLCLADVEALIQDFKHTHRATIQSWQIDIIKTPHQSYFVDNDPILVIDEQGLIMPLNEMSFMINAISDKSEHTAFVCIDSVIADESAVVQLVKKLKEISMKRLPA